jgi:ABC-2 type transport system ATP-binding protein
MSEIRVDSLTKTYGRDVQALRGVSLTIPSGSIFGLLGPNGSGKTTMVKILAGIIRDFQGEVRIDGVRLPTRRVSGHLGYMPQASALYGELTLRENLDFFGAVSGLRSAAMRRKRIDELCALLDLTDKRDSPIHVLSGGMRQRASLGCALLHRPRVLLLDEPTVGLDPRLRRQFWDYFREQARAGSTILITTHIFDEAKYCGELALLQAGRLVVAGQAAELAERAGSADFEQVYLHYLERR